VLPQIHHDSEGKKNFFFWHVRLCSPSNAAREAVELSLDQIFQNCAPHMCRPEEYGCVLAHVCVHACVEREREGGGERERERENNVQLVCQVM
jgi:hypothetical protein